MGSNFLCINLLYYGVVFRNVYKLEVEFETDNSRE